jgi:potassium channel subfamily K
MANRLPFLASQLLTVPSFFVSSVILIITTTLTTHTLLPSTEEYSLASPFYYACISAALSMLISLLLTYTFYLARLRHETPADLSATLTLPQRTLTFQSLAFIMYLMTGAGIFSAIESWKFTDGVYWATVTLLTIGFGDIVPKTHAGRSLIMFYATAGIVSIGLVIGSIASLVLDRSAKKIVARKMVNVRMKKVRNGLPGGVNSEQLTGRDEDNSEQHIKKEKAEFALMREIQADVASSQQWQCKYYFPAVK